MYTGTEVLRSAYNAMIGACTCVNSDQFVWVSSHYKITNQDAKNVAHSSSESISCAAVVGREDFRCSGKKHAVHDL